MAADLAAWLRRVRELDGSDLLLVAGVPPMVKAAGRLMPVSKTALDTEAIEAAVLPHVPLAAKARYRNGEAVDFAMNPDGITRKAGSFTFEESLARLVQQGLLERKDAVMRAAHGDELESILGRG
jgi:Tfp pilus assembly ATPase PilU